MVGAGGDVVLSACCCCEEIVPHGLRADRIFIDRVMWKLLPPSELSSRPEQDGFIVLRSGETCRLPAQAIVPVQRSCRSLHYGDKERRLRSR